MPQLANPGIRRRKTPFSSRTKRPITDCSKTYGTPTIIVKTAKKSTSNTTRQMKGCIRHITRLFLTAKLPLHTELLQPTKYQTDPLNRAHFILTWTSQLRSCQWRLYPKRGYVGILKLTLKPTRYTARFTVSKNIKDPPPDSLSFPEMDSKPNVFLP